jgi:ABC-type multidrug transport system fused ATPase/permease subunit
MEEIKTACAQAQILDFIESLEDGYVCARLCDFYAV